MTRNREPLSDYERIIKILSLMDTSKPVALVTISQQTGIKLADIIRDCNELASMDIVRQLRESGNIFYILLVKDYEKIIEEKYQPQTAPEPVKTPIDSREAILRRRRSMREAAAAANERENTEDEDNNNGRMNPDALGVRRNRLTASGAPEPISAVDLLSMRRSITSPLSGGRMGRVSGIGTTTYPSKDPRSSSSHKAVYVNNEKGMPRTSPSRSSFSSMPPMYDSLGLERSDTNFKQVRPEEHQAALLSLIPDRISSRSNHEVSENAVFEKLNITKETPLLTILSPRVTPETWIACSALVNAGGGILILGMRKYIQAGEVTYFIKSVANPEDSIKRLINAFGERHIISDCPKEPSFVSVVEFGKKKVLVCRLLPTQFTSLPLYLERDSFGTRPNQGCFIYRNGEAVRCTVEETKLLWEKFHLNDDIPDWEQSGEIAPIKLEHKLRVNLPPVIDDAVRPLSRKESTFGQPISQNDIRFSRRFMASSEPIQRDHKEPPVPVSAFTKSPLTTSSAQPFESLSHPSDVTPEVSSHSTEAPAERNTLQHLLFAEDIRTNSIPKPVSATLSPSEPQPEPEVIPPLLSQADQKRIDTIVEPAVAHSRLPSARLCEIAAELLKEVRLSPIELSDLLNRKMPVIRTKIFPMLKESYKLQLVDNKYYIRK